MQPLENLGSLCAEVCRGDLSVIVQKRTTLLGVLNEFVQSFDTRNSYHDFLNPDFDYFNLTYNFH